MFAIIQNGIVVNVIVWDGDESIWQPPEGTTAVQVQDDQVAYIGFPYVDGVFHSPPPPGL